MAESIESNSSTPSSTRSEDGDNEEMAKKPEATTSTVDSKLECPVCLQTCVHPVRLPCGHIFCFLCVKGVAFKNLRCAMCRCDIPLTYLDHPQLVNGVEEIVRAATATASGDGDNEYRWYYEGGHGWWQYDERTSQELEEAYLRGEKSCKILVAGFVYIVSFEHKCQIRQNDYSRIRRIKRDLVTIPKKGVAGLRLDTGSAQNPPPSTSTDMNELSSAMGEMNLNDGASTSTSAVGGVATNVPTMSDTNNAALLVQNQATPERPDEGDGESGNSNESVVHEEQDVPPVVTSEAISSPSSVGSRASGARNSASDSAIDHVNYTYIGHRPRGTLVADLQEPSSDSDFENDESSPDDDLLIL
uniref:E3 ubiquitin-protein ligase n=1 Tax=Anopheles farauti TaxID=69004 RepID=A0A182QNH4_9DIPT